MKKGWIIAGIVIVVLIAFGSCGSSKKSYTAYEADKNNDGYVSGKEFQNQVKEYLDDHGY